MHTDDKILEEEPVHDNEVNSMMDMLAHLSRNTSEMSEVLNVSRVINNMAMTWQNLPLSKSRA